MGVDVRKRRKGMPSGSGLVLGAVLLAVPGLAANESAKAAADAWANVDYESCTVSAKAALDEPDDREGRTTAYRYLGLCEAALGDTDAARDAFIRMLAVDIEATIPDDLSPRFRSSFLEAKGEWVDRAPTGVSIVEDRREDVRRILQIKIDDQLGLIDQIAWRDPDGELHDTTKAAERMELDVPHEVAKQLVGLDAGQGVIVVLPLEAAATPEGQLKDKDPEGSEAGATEADAGGSFLTSPWLWLGLTAVGALLFVSVVALAGGGYGASVALGIPIYEPRFVSLEGEVKFADQLE